MLFKGLALAALAGAAFAQDEPTPSTPDLVTLLANQTELSNLTQFLGMFQDFTTQLGSLENITLLAPNDDAFAEFLNSSAGAALAGGDEELITALFSYHVINGTYANLSEAQFVPTLLAPGQFANVSGGQRLGVYDNDGDLEIVSGLLSVANVTGEPLNFTGGVVHIIDSVLMVPENVSETATELNLTAAAGALVNLTLADTVDTAEDITVFVPNNDAFAAIGSALPNLTTEELTSILTYHVVPGVVGYSNLLENGTQLPTLEGTNVTITVTEDDEVYVNGARVVIPDVLVANGVVHVIDNVLNPQNATATAPEGSESGSPAFDGASSASDVPFTSGARQPTGTNTPTATAPQATADATGSEGAAPIQTAAIGAAALFGGAALVLNM